MYALWGLGLMMLAKNILVVSEHVDVQNLSEVAWRATGNVDAKRDLVIVDGPTDDLDHAAIRHRFGGKLGTDATERPNRRHRQPGPRDRLDAATRALSPRWASTPSSRRESVDTSSTPQVRATVFRALRLRGHGARPNGWPDVRIVGVTLAMSRPTLAMA